MADSLGRTVSGVEVGFNESAESLTFTGSTTNDTSFIQVWLATRIGDWKMLKRDLDRHQLTSP